MNRLHTLRSIADEARREKRTAQVWYQKAKDTYGEIGEVGSDGTRYFSDEERSVLLTYAGADRPSKPVSSVEVETGNHQIVLSTPELPQTYTLEGLRASEAVVIEDPLAIAAQFLAVADQIQTAMQTDIQQREHRLQQTKQAKDAIAAKASELKLEQRFYKERASMVDALQTQETQTLQSLLGNLQSLGKPQEPAG